MPAAISNNVSSFGVVQSAEDALLASQNEDKKALKVSIKTKKEYLEDKRQERIDNLHKQMHAAGGSGGCLKFIKTICVVATAITAPLTAGGSLGLFAGATAALNIANATLTAIGAITTALADLQEALKSKKILLTKAQGQQIMSIITETEKWIEDEKMALDDVHEDQKKAFDEYLMQIKDLEASLSTMIST